MAGVAGGQILGPEAQIGLEIAPVGDINRQVDGRAAGVADALQELGANFPDGGA